MLEFTVMVILCSSFPPSKEHCVMPVGYVAQFKTEEQCLKLASIIARSIPFSENYQLKGWSCEYIGDES